MNKVSACVRGVAVTAALLLACGCAMSTDSFGYEKRPLGADQKFAGVLTILDTPADELGEKCFVSHGYLARDARACAIPQGKRCTALVSPNMAPDRRVALLKWTNAICNGWRPGLR